MDYANLSTDKDNLVIGDLDTNGFIEGPIFATDKTKIEATVAAGTVSGEYTFAVSNISTPEAVSVNALLPDGLGWVTVNPTTSTILSGQPAVFRVRFNATSLPPGLYGTTVTLTSLQPVINQPYSIALELTVIPPKLQPVPGGLSIFMIPCDESACTPAEQAEQSGPITRTIRIGGSNDLVYQAAIVGMPDDVASAASSNGLQGEITGARSTMRATWYSMMPRVMPTPSGVTCAPRQHCQPVGPSTPRSIGFSRPRLILPPCRQP